MKILDFNEANCKNCYKCVRNCSVKAIKIVDDQAQIIEDKCIACGTCFLVCPQNARKIHSDLDNLIFAIKNNKKVVVSIAPSYVGLYTNPSKIIGALRKLGIYAIEETAVGADVVTKLYREYIEKSNKKNIITSCCPSANLMIQEYYPKLIPYLIPVDSPMITHSKMIKKKYGQDTFVAFIGPCIAKKCEAYDYEEDLIDAVLTFEEVDEWIEKEEIDINDCENGFLDARASSIGKQYPSDGGVLEGIKDIAIKNNYSPLAIDGTKNCKEIFNSLVQSEIEKVCIEVNMCDEGCIGGPGIPKDSNSIFLRKTNIRKNLNNNKTIDEIYNDEFCSSVYTFDRTFKNREYKMIEPTKNELKNILEKMGKYTKDDELNCGACGYDSCIEKAKAVFEGLSYPEMCIPYMRSKAERLSNIIFEYSPNILIIFDKNLDIIDMNPEAERIFQTRINKVKGKHISKFIDSSDFDYVISSGQNILAKKINIEKYGVKVLENIIYIPEQKIFFAILANITDEENEKEKLIDLKLNTLTVANNVIEKQMRVAQEIAGLLGETTAETKAALLNLKKVVSDEKGGV